MRWPLPNNTYIEKIEGLMRASLKPRARQKPGTTSEPPEATGGKAKA